MRTAARLAAYARALESRVAQALAVVGAPAPTAGGVCASAATVLLPTRRGLASAATATLPPNCGFASAAATTATLPPNCGFAFDIDGVLLHGRHPLPGAKAALAAVRAANAPHVFLTNGGGLLEADRAAQLATLLDAPSISEDQVILSHTPMRALAERYGDAPVLVVGGGSTPAVAAAYGFKRAFTPWQVHAAFPHAVPPAPAPPPAGTSPLPPDVGTPSNPFRAVLVLNDPACYATDLQIVCDVLAGGGVITERVRGAAPPPIFFSNSDLIYPNLHPVPRLGQGAFAAALDAIYRAVTGRDLTQVTRYGKPERAPYELARARLAAQAAARSAPPPSHVYMVGDNPAADIAGANRHGFEGLLVLSGVAQQNCDINPAVEVFAGVADAVAWALERHGVKGVPGLV